MAERVVFDTNTMISGLLWRGKPYQRLLLARSRVVEAFFCRQMLDELAEKLCDKFRFSAEMVEATLSDWRARATEVTITGGLHVVAEDPDDDMFIECALVAGAKIVVSGDKHLKRLGRYQDVRVLTAGEMVERVQGVGSE